MESIAVFGAWDYTVLAMTLIISMAIGVYYRFTGGKQKTAQEYLLADRTMPALPVAFSLMASFMSAITLLGLCSENYTYGFQFIVINVSYAICTPIAAYVYLPVFYKLQATSAYEYLEKRFGQTSRIVASLSYSLQMILYMGVVLYAPALALEALTGISQLTAILSVGLICTFYSTIGGMKAVLITDMFQSFLMFGAVFSVIGCAAWEVGFGGIWGIASKGGRIELLNFNPDPTDRHNWFTLVIGGGITFLSIYAVNQTQVQRYMTVKDLKTAQKAIWLNWPILTGLSLSTSFSGLAIYSKYYNCDPVCSGKIRRNDQLMPYYVIDMMGHIPGISGLFVAGIFSGSISSMSSSLNSLAAVTIEDYYKPLYRKLWDTEMPQKTVNIYMKLIVMFYGFVCLAVAFLAQFLGGVLQAALTIFGVIGGPLLGLFSLGMFTITANEEGGMAGLVSGMSFALWMAFGQPKPALQKLPMTIEGCDFVYKNITCNPAPIKPDSEYFWLYRVSYLYNGVFGFVITFIVGWLISFLIKKVNRKEEVPMNPDLFVPYLSKQLEKRWDRPLNLNGFKGSDE